MVKKDRPKPSYKTVYGEKKQLEHVRVVERALGKALRSGAVIHHFDENGMNNSPENLIVCPDQFYHFLLHRRQDALKACGHPGWEKCTECKQWDDPQNLRIYHYQTPKRSRRIVHHMNCWRERQARRYKERHP